MEHRVLSMIRLVDVEGFRLFRISTETYSQWKYQFQFGIDGAIRQKQWKVFPAYTMKDWEFLR